MLKIIIIFGTVYRIESKNHSLGYHYHKAPCSEIT